MFHKIDKNVKNQDSLYFASGNVKLHSIWETVVQ